MITDDDKSILAPYDAEARTMNVRQFAERHHQLSKLRLWGNPPAYCAVSVDGTDYLWNLTDGKYDGWDRQFSEGERLI